MGKKFQTLPDNDELIRIAVAASESAVRKLKAATALLDAEQWPEAFYNAALGLEEAGKAHLCLDVLVHPPKPRDDAEALKEFNATFNSHEKKAERAQWVQTVMLDEDAPDTVAELLYLVGCAARAANDLKFRGLYADFVDGQVQHPEEVSELPAEWAVQTLQAVCGWIVPQVTTVAGNPDKILSAAATLMAKTDMTALAAMYENDPDGFVREMRDSILDRGPVPQWMIDMLLKAPEHP